VGHQNFTARIKSSNLKWNQRFPPPLHPCPHSTEGKFDIFIAFLTSSLVEAGFSWTFLLPKVHNHLDIVTRGDLHLSLTA
jgi:hypothetical protein